jgi:integrase
MKNRDSETLPKGISIRAERYFARVTIKGKQRSRAFDTVEEAQAWRDTQLRAAGQSDRLVGTGPPLAGYARQLLDDMENGGRLNRGGDRYDPGLVRRYRSTLERIWLPALGTHPVDKIRRRDVQAILNELAQEGKAGSTVRDALKPMQVIYRELIFDEITSRDFNPTVYLRLPRKSSRKARIDDPNDPLRIIGIEEAKQRIALLPGRERVIWALAFFAGLRMGEIRGLDWRDIDTEQLLVHVRRQIVTNEHTPKLPKGGKVRSVPMFEELRGELIVWALEQGNGNVGLVAAGPEGTKFTYSDVVKHTRRAWQAAGLGWVTPHEARHTFVSMLAAANVPSDEARVYSGHSSEEVRQLYTHLMPNAHLEAIRRVEEWMRSQRHG